MKKIVSRKRIDKALTRFQNKMAKADPKTRTIIHQGIHALDRFVGKLDKAIEQAEKDYDAKNRKKK